MKILCPQHQDSNASLHVYSDGGFCFVCQYRCTLEELDLDEEEVKRVKKEPEDIKTSLSYIESLPKVYIRQLWFPADRNGFYVVWPDGSYYKKRLYSGTVRYIGPVGHKAPLFSYAKGGPLILTEGEINALSFKTYMPNFTGTIASPGSCNEFTRHIDKYLQYDSIFVIVDRDEPGVREGLKLGRELLKRGKTVKLVSVEKDINEVLVQDGPEAVRHWTKKNLGV